MDKTHIFIAPKIKVGFQTRDDCFTKKLAYIIYFDDKGKLRKEKSWQSWIDKKIPAEEFDNAPLEGFTLNKDIKRYSGEWFSSHRTMIRVHDPRGFEFEVTTENLIGILMHTDCLKRGLIGSFVYAWIGQELVLLPTNSEEYQQAIQYTAGLSKKVSTKDIVVGASYKTKREGDVTYLGRMNWYEYEIPKKYGLISGLRKERKAHTFTNDDGKTFFSKDSLSFLSEANTTCACSNYASLIDKFNKHLYANKIVKYEFRKAQFNQETKKEQYGDGRFELKYPNYFVKCGGVDNKFTHQSFSVYDSYTAGQTGKVDYYSLDNSSSYYRNKQIIEDITGLIENHEVIKDSYNLYSYSYNNNSSKRLTLEDIQKLDLYSLYVILENGKEVQLRELDGGYYSNYNDTKI